MEISLFLQLTVLSVIISFVLIQILDNKENLYLNATNPGSKKLMVVDQQTGAISFLNESVQGIDQAFATSDSTTNALLKTLFGEEMDGTAGVFAEKLSEMDTRLSGATTTLQGYVDDNITLVRAKVGNIRHGDVISLLNHTDFASGGWGDYADVGFGDHDKGTAGGSTRTGVLNGNVEWGHGKNAGGMRIHSRNHDNNTRGAEKGTQLWKYVADWNRRN